MSAVQTLDRLIYDVEQHNLRNPHRDTPYENRSYALTSALASRMISAWALYLDTALMPSWRCAPFTPAEEIILERVMRCFLLVTKGAQYTFTNPVFVPALRETWPKVWSWIQYVDHQLAFNPNGVELINAVLMPALEVIYGLDSHASLASTVPYTPGLVPLLTRQWVQTPFPLCYVRSLAIISKYKKRPADLFVNEMSQAFTGSRIDSMDALGMVFLRKARHLDCSSDINYIYGFLRLLYIVSMQIEPSVLLNNGILAQVLRITMFCAHELLSAESGACQEVGFDIITLLLKQGKTTHLVDALDNGFLLLILIQYVSGSSAPMVAEANHFLQHVIPSKLVYYSVLDAMERAVKEPTMHKLIGKMYSIRQWTAVYGLFRERQSFRKTLERKAVSFHCATVSCGMTKEVKLLKRCMGCRLAYYCSVDCQKHDWERHRVRCRTFAAHIYEGTVEPLRTRDRILVASLAKQAFWRHYSSLQQKLSMNAVIDVDFTSTQPSVSISPKSIEEVGTDGWEDVVDESKSDEGMVLLCAKLDLDGRNKVFTSVKVPG